MRTIRIAGERARPWRSGRTDRWRCGRFMIRRSGSTRRIGSAGLAVGTAVWRIQSAEFLMRPKVKDDLAFQSVPCRTRATWTNIAVCGAQQYYNTLVVKYNRHIPSQTSIPDSGIKYLMVTSMSLQKSVRSIFSRSSEGVSFHHFQAINQHVYIQAISVEPLNIIPTVSDPTFHSITDGRHKKTHF